MHQVDFDLNTGELTKVEGAAELNLRVRNGKVEYAHFGIIEYKRFFTEAMKGKPVDAIPQLVARICGTCSNAHLLCSIEACEHALGIVPTEQTKFLRLLTMYGLNIRDHALHLYLFCMPDIFGKDSFMDFDENDSFQDQMLHDAFNIKAVGNQLAIMVAGRSVHATYPAVGGYLHVPTNKEVEEIIKKLRSIRPAVIRLINFFAEKNPFHFDRKTDFLAMISDRCGFIDGVIKSSTGEVISKENFSKHLEHTVLEYSQASAYKYKGRPYMVGALGRLNMASDRLHPNTRKDAGSAIKQFPSTDIFKNNLAQAIEILHAIDDSIEILTKREFKLEQIPEIKYRDAVGIGVIEAPRGLLYHKVTVGADGLIKEGEVVVPTGQNQTNIEEDITTLVNEMLPDHPSMEKITFEIEKLIRAYDPCMSCGSHFLKVNVDKE
ncbi:MAG: nickel-dependent hydrogenase large subunit [Patescibacteria group bacterium]|jgi:coenzyme F420-reducing hydrogenase alpha subunit